MTSPVLHSPGFLLTWQIEHSQSSSMTTSHKSQAFPTVCHRDLCWAQFSSSSTQNLFLTWLIVTRLSLTLSRTILSSKSLSLHRTVLSSLETCLSDIQVWMLENKLKLSRDKTEALLQRSSSESFSVSKPTYHLCLWLWNIFLLLLEILVFTSEMTWTWNYT